MPSPAHRPRHAATGWLLFVTQALFVLLAGAAAWFVGVRIYGPVGSSRPLTEYECRMPDGSILKIEALTTGGAHSFTHRAPAGDGLLNWLSGPARHVLSETLAGSKQIVVWLSRQNARTGRPLDFDWWAENVAIDASGNAISKGNPGYATLHEFNGQSYRSQSTVSPLLADRVGHRSWILSSPLPVFRPKGARLELKVKNTAGDVVASFDVPHPAPTPFPEWTAEPLPRTFTDGDLALTVTGVHTGVADATKWAEYWARPNVQFRWQGRPTTDWQVSAVRFTSPLDTAMDSDDSDYLLPGRPAARASSIDSSLLSERVWKMTLTCVRHDRAAFTAAERVRLEPVTIPAADKAELVNRSLAANGCDLILVAAGGSGTSSIAFASPRLGLGPGVFPYSMTYSTSPFEQEARVNARSSHPGGAESATVTSPFPWLLFDRVGVAADRTVRLRIRDDQGRDVPTDEESVGKHISLLALQPEPDATSLTIDATVQEPVEFEALVELPRPAAPSPTTPGKQPAAPPAPAP